MANYTIQEIDPITGIETTVHRLDGKVAIQKGYDAAPFLDLAAEARAATAGQRWGEMRHVGTIPMAELSKFYRQDGRLDKKRMIAWLKTNPAFVTFDKLLK